MNEVGRVTEWALTLPAGRRNGPPRAEDGEAAPVLGRLPRIVRLMALAIKFAGMIEAGVAADYADLARLGGVTRARMTQIMNLLNLAPDIQEQILFLPCTLAGRDPITERALRQVSSLADWDRQRRLWQQFPIATQ
jgi:hypothetical protein